MNMEFLHHSDLTFFEVHEVLRYQMNLLAVTWLKADQCLYGHDEDTPVIWNFKGVRS